MAIMNIKDVRRKTARMVDRALVESDVPHPFDQVELAWSNDGELVVRIMDFPNASVRIVGHRGNHTYVYLSPIAGVVGDEDESPA